MSILRTEALSRKRSEILPGRWTLENARVLVLAFVSAVIGCYWWLVGFLAYPLKKDALWPQHRFSTLQGIQPLTMWHSIVTYRCV